MVEDVIRVEDQFYILATSSLADDRTRVLKHNESFAVFDRFGDIQPVGQARHGIFHEGTRYLSQLVLHLGRGRPLLLSSTVKDDNGLLAVDLTNFDVSHDGEVAVPRGTLHIHRAKLLWDAVCHESLRFRNYGMGPLDVVFSLRFDADYADIFEVRGIHRDRRGRRLQDRVEGNCVVLAYEGLDGVVRRTRLEANPRPRETSAAEMKFACRLAPQEEREFCLTIACENETPRSVCSFDTALAHQTDTLNEIRAHDCTLHTANEQFNDWINRSVADLHMMITQAPGVLYPYAGVPWYSTAFGRDGIITALEYLWVNPLIARGVLRYLAATQATEFDEPSDAEPGKILHERRDGEMAVLGEHPFRRYYGSIDATPLFIILAGEYYQRTGDRGLIESIWPNLEAALEWIDRYGDRDGDGFVEYARRTQRGLVQQGWKDSQDSVFHADGRLAEPPIALCEVQAYVYAARQRAAELAEMLGRPERAAQLRSQAAGLRENFERAFWSEELSCYVLALDGEKRPCQVRTSNAGHCLMTGIAARDRAARTAATLLSPDLFSGWGIRTLAAGEVRYNPMSYHNGSVWPHDNALIACGLSRYKNRDLVARVLTGLFDASIFLDQQRLPELFCGFGRRPGEGPTQYPVACSPQAWASASVFLLLQAVLGLSIHAVEQQVCFTRAHLPEFLPEIRMKNLRVGDAVVDLHLERHDYNVGVTVLRRQGEVDIVSVK